MRVRCDIFKITAIGCNKRFMWIELPLFNIRCIRISDGFYNYLKSKGVPTAQKLAWIKRKLNK